MQDKNQRLVRARAAKRFLDDEQIQTLVVAQKEQFFKRWADTDPKAVEDREAIYAEYRGLLRVINELRTYIVDGKVIEENERQSPS